MTEDTTLFTFLVIDTNDLNRVHWCSIDGITAETNERLARLEQRVTELEGLLAQAEAMTQKGEL